MPPDNAAAPGRGTGGPMRRGGRNTTVAAIADELTHLQRRVVQDAIASASAAQLERRAEAFERAKHRPGVDWPGRATLDELRAQWLRCDEAARALRNKAALCRRREGNDDSDVWEAVA